MTQHVPVRRHTLQEAPGVGGAGCSHPVPRPSVALRAARAARRRRRASTRRGTPGSRQRPPRWTLRPGGNAWRRRTTATPISGRASSAVLRPPAGAAFHLSFALRVPGIPVQRHLLPVAFGRPWVARHPTKDLVPQPTQQGALCAAFASTVGWSADMSKNALFYGVRPSLRLRYRRGSGRAGNDRGRTVAVLGDAARDPVQRRGVGRPEPVRARHQDERLSTRRIN